MNGDVRLQRTTHRTANLGSRPAALPQAKLSRGFQPPPGLTRWGDDREWGCWRARRTKPPSSPHRRKDGGGAIPRPPFSSTSAVHVPRSRSRSRPPSTPLAPRSFQPQEIRDAGRRRPVLPFPHEAGLALRGSRLFLSPAKVTTGNGTRTRSPAIDRCLLGCIPWRQVAPGPYPRVLPARDSRYAGKPGSSGRPPGNSSGTARSPLRISPKNGSFQV